MANWKMTLDLTGDGKWNAASDDESMVPELCRSIAEKLEKLMESPNASETDKRGLRQYADDFRALADDDADHDEFNYLWSYFYDWADVDKRLWVKLL